MSILTAHKKSQKVFVALSNQHSVIFCAPLTIWPVVHYVVIVKYIIAGRLLVLIKCNNRRNKALFVCCVVVITRQLTEVCVTELPKKRARRSKRSQSGAVHSKLSTISSTFKPSDPPSDDTWKCHICSVIFGSADDPKLHDDWITCTDCQNRYHETCAENDGVFDDDLQFTCKHCIDWLIWTCFILYFDTLVFDCCVTTNVFSPSSKLPIRQLADF